MFGRKSDKDTPSATQSNQSKTKVDDEDWLELGIADMERGTTNTLSEIEISEGGILGLAKDKDAYNVLFKHAEQKVPEPKPKPKMRKLNDSQISNSSKGINPQSDHSSKYKDSAKQPALTKSVSKSQGSNASYDPTKSKDPTRQFSRPSKSSNSSKPNASTESLPVRRS